MLNDDLYKIDSFKNADGNIEAVITIHTNHEIFKGHFPNQPVLPGVCMMQIFKELLEKAINKKLFLFRADNSKFLMMVNPSQTPQLTFTIDFAITDDIVKANGVLKNDAAVFLKLSNYSFKYDR